MAVISLDTYRKLKNSNDVLLAYKAKLLQVDKLQLLEEMVRFQEERSKIKDLTLPMIQQGLILFDLLHKSAETAELRLLTRAYKRHLAYELKKIKGDYEPEPVA